MYRDDFILRHIRLFVLAIAKALKLIQDGDPGFALETVRVSFNDLLGMSMDDFLAYPDDRVKEFLYFGELGPMGLNRMAFAASMLVLAGRIHAGMKQPERSRVHFEKALRVLLETALGEEEAVEFPEFTPSIDEILTEVQIGDLGDDLLAMLAFYFDRIGDVDRAHTSVQALLTRHPNDPDTREMARSFYEYLLEDDTRLQAHRLTMDEIRRELEKIE
jgi:hypothetical protein